MDQFATLGSRASKAKAAYQHLQAIARAGEPCPSLAELGSKVGIAESTMGKLLAAMDDAGLIRRIPLESGARIVEIVATGERTGPTQQVGAAGIARAVFATATNAAGWPRQTMTPDGFVAAVAAAGRFEDSPRARRDLGWPRNASDLPAAATVFSPCGISRVYDHGGSGQRNVAGRL